MRLYHAAYTFPSSMTNHCTVPRPDGIHRTHDILVTRIGREPTPGESTIQLLREQPAVLELMGQRLFTQTQGLYGDNAVQAWRALPEPGRESWCDEAFILSLQAARDYEERSSTALDAATPNACKIRLVE